MAYLYIYNRNSEIFGPTKYFNRKIDWVKFPLG